jgi:uncharacterized protein YbjT (DUF2867 family)
MSRFGRIFITGGSGFVGTTIIRHLLDQDYQVTTLSRSKSKVPTTLSSDARLSVHQGDITNSGSFVNAITGHETVINLVGIIREIKSSGITFRKVHVDGTRNVVEAAFKGGVRRFIQMSALGASENAESEYHKTKWEAEEIVRNSGLNFTIFRPSIIFGEDGELLKMLADTIRKFRMFPLFDSGMSLMQPIMVDDVADGFVKCIEMNNSIGKTYEAGGYAKYQFKQIIHLIADALGLRVYTPSVPVWMVKPFVRIFESQSWFPLTMDQLTMLLKDNVTDNTMFFDDLDIHPVDFEQALGIILKHKRQ